VLHLHPTEFAMIQAKHSGVSISESLIDATAVQSVDAANDTWLLGEQQAEAVNYS
jgi:hypothetical protein